MKNSTYAASIYLKCSIAYTNIMEGVRKRGWPMSYLVNPQRNNRLGMTRSSIHLSCDNSPSF